MTQKKRKARYHIEATGCKPKSHGAVVKTKHMPTFLGYELRLMDSTLSSSVKLFVPTQPLPGSLAIGCGDWETHKKRRLSRCIGPLDLGREAHGRSHRLLLGRAPLSVVDRQTILVPREAGLYVCMCVYAHIQLCQRSTRHSPSSRPLASK